MKKYPFVTYVIATYNADKYLEKCLKSVYLQNYPKSRYEVFIVDGGSTDNTIKIAKKYKARILDNPKKNPEIAKSIGIKKSSGEIVVLLDSDNEIVKKDWLQKMVVPFEEDPNIFGVESLYFPSKGESIFNTYCMLAHIADPFSRCMAARLNRVEKQHYEEYTIPERGVYPLGANGFLWSKKIIKKVGNYDPIFEESNFCAYAGEKGYRKFARVSGYGIYNYHIVSLKDFVKKRLKIGNKFLNRKVEKKKTWLGGNALFSQRFVFCVFYCFTIVGPFIEGVYNAIRSKNKAWLLHPLMSFVSVTIYIYVYLSRIIFSYGKVRKIY